MSVPVERSITVSAPQRHDHCSFSTSSSIDELTAELPMLAFTFTRKLRPMIIGSLSGMVDVGRNDRPAPGDLRPHELGIHVLPHGDEPHLRSDDALPGVVHLGYRTPAAEHFRPPQRLRESAPTAGPDRKARSLPRRRGRGSTPAATAADRDARRAPPARWCRKRRAAARRWRTRSCGPALECRLRRPNTRRSELPLEDDAEADPSWLARSAISLMNPPYAGITQVRF